MTICVILNYNKIHAMRIILKQMSNVQKEKTITWVFTAAPFPSILAVVFGTDSTIKVTDGSILAMAPVVTVLFSRTLIVEASWTHCSTTVECNKC